MTSWTTFETEAPDLAKRVQLRFEATGLAFLASLRKDGSPRISAVEPLIAAGDVWIGMMEGSLKAADLTRDGRFALHAASVDKNVAEGDAKLAGVAVPVSPEDRVRFVDAMKAINGWIPEGEFPLFRTELTEVSFLKPEGGDHLLIEIWKPGQGVRRVERK